MFTLNMPGDDTEYHDYEYNAASGLYTCRKCGEYTNWPGMGWGCSGLPERYSPKDHGLCTQCRAALCPELDAYYGKDPDEALKCTPCRLGRRSSSAG